MFYLAQDGTVTILQEATKGNGIDIIIMGDAYSERQIVSGKYSSDMRKAIDMLFDEEPYKSFRNLFNIYQVTAVSENEGYGKGSTAFDGYFGAGTESEVIMTRSLNMQRRQYLIITVLMRR